MLAYATTTAAAAASLTAFSLSSVLPARVTLAAAGLTGACPAPQKPWPWTRHPGHDALHGASRDARSPGDSSRRRHPRASAARRWAACSGFNGCRAGCRLTRESRGWAAGVLGQVGLGIATLMGGVPIHLASPHQARPSRTDWTRLVLPPVLTGHVSSG